MDCNVIMRDCTCMSCDHLVCVCRCISSVCVWVQIYEEYPIVSAALATQTYTCRYYSLHGGSGGIPTASYSQVNCTLIHTLTHHRFGDGIRAQCASAAIYSRDPRHAGRGEVEAVQKSLEQLLPSNRAQRKGRAGPGRDVVDGNWRRGPGGFGHIFSPF